MPELLNLGILVGKGTNQYVKFHGKRVSVYNNEFESSRIDRARKKAGVRKCLDADESIQRGGDTGRLRTADFAQPGSSL